MDGTALGQGTATGERIGSSSNIQGDGSLNDYRLQDTAQISTGGVLTVGKGVDNSTPSIGDVLTYTVTLTLNEGTTQGIVITDNLPANGDLQFVAGSAAVAFGTAGSTISGSVIPAVSGANNNVLTFTLGNAVIPAGAGANTVVVTYQVRVANVTTNQAGDLEINSASVTATNLPTPPPGTTTVTLREPNVNFTKTPDVTTNVDAGDVITYTVVLTNPGGANASTAFDVLLTDTMPANLLATTIVSTTLAGGATTDSAAAITGGGTGASGQYDIPVGGTVTIVYAATVQTGFQPNGSLTNNAELTWTSINGGNSTAPDANERFGAAGSTFGDGSLNDYRRTTNATTTGYGPAFAKVLFSTSESATAGSNFGIGEVVTYGLLVTLPEGTTPDLSVIDNLPIGVQYLSSSIVTSAAASNGFLTADFAGTVPVPTVTGGVSNGDDVTFTFGTITVAGDNNAASNSFLILLNARVLDESSNVGTNPPGRTTLVNNATLDIPSDPQPPIPSNNISGTVAEPRLQIIKGVNDSTPDVGLTLTYTLTISHSATSTADAFDILVRDAMPAGLTLIPASIVVTGATVTANNSTAALVSLDLDGLIQSGTITVTFDATVANDVALAAQTLSNNARIYWDTLAADEPTNAVLNNAPDGTPDRDLGATNGYIEAATPTPNEDGQDTEDVVVNGINNTINGLVYHDVNADGDYDAGTDSLLNGVNLSLVGTDVNGNPVAFSTTTVAGAYNFTNLLPGTYTITETTPAGFVDGLETAGTNFGGVVSSALGSETISTITIPVGPTSTGTGYNFGEVLSSSLAGFTYLDNNSDGLFIAESSLGGILVTLTGTDVFGQAVTLNVTTAPDGSYSFPGLRPGSYTITEDDSAVVPGTYFDGKDTVGTAGGTVGGTSPKNDVLNVTLAQNTNGANYNFGEIEKSSLSGSVYIDLDNDGVRDPAEPGVSGATVTLTGTDDLGNVINVAATTNSTGAYAFSNLRPGTYTITETQPFGYLDGTDTQGQPGTGTVGNDVISNITLNGGIAGAGNIFGELYATTLTKSVVSTSLASTAGNNLAIGEVVRYRLTATVPFGSIDDAQLVDFLPAGLIFLNDGSATVGFVSPTGTDLTSSVIAGGGLTSVTSPTVVLPDGSISASTTTNSDIYASGTDVFFKFGTLTNNTAGVDSGTVVIEFNAQVVNELGNQTGTTLDNSFGSRIDTDGDGISNPLIGSSNTVTATVVEPNLTIGKAASPNTNVIAGDTITYTLTFGNNGSSTAYDSVVTDTAPAHLQITGIVSTTLAGGATVDNAAAITGGGTGLAGQYDVPVGGSVTITYTATVLATYPIGTQLVNSADLTWTSLPGGNSGTPDSGERFGVSPNVVGDGSLNDYRQVVTNGVNGLPFIPQVQKAIVSTSEPGSTGTNVLVGEVVRFELRVELYQGAVALATIKDFLPAGLQFLPDGPVEVSFENVATSVTGFAAGIYTNATNDPFISAALSTDDDNFADGTDVFFKFGNIRNNDTDADREFVVVRFNALVTNTAGNVDGTVLNNDFGVLADINGNGFPGFVSVDRDGDGQATNSEVANDPSNNGTGTPGLSNTVSVTVVEPDVELDSKTLLTATIGDAGDTVTYSIVLTNSGSGPAYDLVLGDILDVGLTGVSVSLASATPAPVGTDPTAQTVSLGANTILLSRIDAGQTVTLTLTGTLAQSVAPAQVIGNTATLDSYTSLPGSGTPLGANNTTGSTTPGASGTSTGERDGGGGVNNYTGGSQSAANVVVPGGQVVKSLFATSEPATVNPLVAIGEEVTYALLVTLPEGTTTGLSLVDQIPAGMQYVGTTIVTSSAASGGLLSANFGGTVPAPTVAGGAGSGDDVTLSFGSITVTGDNAVGNNSFIALVTMRVLDEAGNSGINPPGQTTLGNVAVLNIPNTPPIPTPPVQVAVVEPRLQISKSVDDAAADLGQTLNYTLTIQHTGASTATAFDLLVRESVPAGLTLIPASINVTSTSGTVAIISNTSTPTSISIDLDSLAQGDVVTITYQATVGTSAALTGTNIDNNARLYWDTSAADEANAILTNTPDGTSDRDFGATDGYVENPSPSPDDLAQDTARVVVNSNLISGFVYIDANADGVFGTENGVDGVTITLTGTDLNGNAVNFSILTGGDGSFIFTNLAAGTYTLTETQPANLTDALESIGTPFGGTKSDAFGSNVIGNIVIPGGNAQSGVNYNFGEVRPSSIAGTVYIDANNDGSNAGDTGISGIAVTLTGTDAFGQAVVVNATTDGNGNYILDNSGAGLRPSDSAGYSVTEGVVPAPFLDGKETAGTLSGVTTTNDVISGIVLPQNTPATGYLFGELPPASLSGFVYSDLDNDGVKDGGEAGLDGVTVTLTGTDDLGNAVSTTVTTDGTGAYSFTALRPGTYTLTETQPGAFFDGSETVGTQASGTVVNTTDSNTISLITLATGVNGANNNFGELAPASLSGNVYADLDNDGTFDAFESGVPGVTITLTGNDDRGNPVNISVTTNAAGGYTFVNLRPSGAAGYTNTETQPANYLDGADTIGTPGGTTNNDSFSAVVLAAGVNGANNNFGEAPDFALTKTLVGTSEAGTTGSNVAIGEVATFRLVVTIPAGSLTNFQVQDILPDGYQYVNGSARAGLVGALTSSTVTAPLAGIGATPTFVLDDASVSNNSLSNNDAYASGSDVFFKFGSLTNTDTTAAIEAIVIEFDAVVVNEATNQAGVTLTNNFRVLYERNPGSPGPEPDPNPPGTPPSVNTTVVTPVLTLTKNATPTGALSAGDPVTYTLTFTNAGGANSSTGFDALITDTMPADILITSITGTVLAGGATVDSAAAITGGGTGLTGQYDIPVGASVTITYTGTVQVSAAPGSAQTNNAALTWTSINGGNSLTPDAGERFGAAGTLFGDANLNNYRRIDSETVTIGVATFDKDLFSTSDAATTGSNAGIGETITYALAITLPAGTAPSLSVVDALPVGLQYVSSSIVTTVGAAAGFLAQDFNGTVPAPSIGGGAADGDDVTFTFGSITTSADGNSNNNTFLILVTARVTDIAGNEGILPGQTTLDNIATFDIPGDGVPPSTPPPVTVTVVEPVLTIDKEFNVTQADAGDTVQISIVVNNTGTGPVHDVLVTDAVNLSKFGSITEVTTPAGFTFNNDPAGTVTFTGGTIAAGSSATFIFSVVLGNGVNPSETLSNTATAFGSTQPGVVVGERTTPVVQDTDTLTVPAIFTLVKGLQSPVGGAVQIGDIVTYTVDVTLLEGTTNNITLTDLLPAGMSYLAGSAVVANANGMTVNGFNAGAVGQTLTIAATSITNPGNVDNAATTDSDTFTITYQAVVNDVAGNTAGTLLANSLTGGGTGVPPSTPPPVNITVTEPLLAITKTANDTTPDLGQVIRFTLTIQNPNVANGATAYDLLVRDALPAGLTNLANITVTGATIDANNSTSSLLDLKLSELALGATATIEFDATVGTTATLVGATIDNNARLYWDTQPGESANSILTGVPDGDSDRDFGAAPGNEVFNQNTDPAQDTERLTVNASSLSGFVYNDANANNAFDDGAANGLVGQTVTLTGTTVFGEVISIIATTGAGGLYAFSNLAPGTYTLTETQPAGYLDGGESVGTIFGGTVNAAIGSDTISTLTIPVGNNSATDYNFGEVLASSLSGFVYADYNNDGAKDAIEGGIIGAGVTLSGTDYLGVAVSVPLTTDAAGAYSFTTLRPGSYTITETTPPAGYADGIDTQGTPGTGTAGNDVFTSIALAGGVNGANNNFGEQPIFPLQKTIVGTSEAGTAGSSVAVGETVRYRLVVNIPTGTLNNVQLQDLIPAGLQFTGNAKVGLVGALTSDSIVAPLAGIGSTPTVDLTDVQVSDNSTTNSDVYGSGADVFFKLGNLTNLDTNGATTEAVVIEFDALVLNESANIAGVTLTNDFRLLHERDTTPGPDPTPDVPPNPPAVTIATPVLTFDKSGTPTGGLEAGSVITYTLTLTNPGGLNSSTAFDSLVRDVMPSNILITSITSTTLNGGATADSVPTITGGGTGLTGQFDIPVGASVTITYEGTIQVAALPGSTLTNNAELTWTSINGGNSLTPDAGERFGGAGTLFGDANLNNYRRIDDLSVTVGTGSMTKGLFGTSDTGTIGSNVAIGEIATFALTITLPQGTTQTLDIVDQLPAGLQFVSSSIVTSAAASNGFLTSDFNGTVNAPTVSGGALDGDDVSFVFSNIVANPDSIPGNSSFVLLVSARVTNVPANVAGATLDNVATFDDPNEPTPPTPTPPVRVDIVTPTLTIDKEFNVTQADAGDTVEVSITVSNTGNAPAYDVIVSDVLDAAKFGNATLITTPAGFSSNNSGNSVGYFGGTIAPGGSATFVFSIPLLDSVNPSEILSNTAVAVATTQPGIVFGERAIGPVADTDTLNVPSVFTLVKGLQSPAGGNVRIGDIVTYSVQVTLLEGTTNNIQLNDILPAGMSYLNGSAVVSDANGMTVNGFNAGAAGQALTITATSITNPGNVDNTATTDSDTFTITYQAVVNDVAGNSAGTILSNSLTGGGMGVPPSNPPPVNVTVAEPSLQITKTTNDSTLELGQTVRFTLTIQNLNVANGADAFDILVRDALPSGLSNIANISVTGATLDADNSTGSLLDLKLGSLALGATATIAFDATVGTNPLLVGTNIDNNARIFWDSQPGESTNTVLAGGSDGDDDRDYGATGPDEIFDQQTQLAQDTERVSINANTLSGFVYQDVDANGVYDVGTDTLLDGVLVTITGNLATDNSPFTTSALSVGGVYTFSNLAAGSYTLTETQPVGYVDGGETVGAPFGGTKSDALGSNTISGLVIPAGGGSGSGYNFGEVLGSSLAAAVYEDANNNGIRDEVGTGIGGASVTFSGTDFLGQAVSFTLNTDSNGNVVFGAGETLRPGTYTVTENVQPAGFLDGRDTDGSLLNGDTSANDVISSIELPQGTSADSYLFGELLAATISGNVYNDANNDGLFVGETGLGGISVTLNGTNDLGVIAPITVQTNADGSYSFGNLRPGVYTVTEAHPATFLDGRDTAAVIGGGIAVNGATDSDEINSITLTSGLVSAGNNFGEVQANSLGGAVYFDLDNDGVRDAGESGITGVSVTLGGTDDRGNPVNIPGVTVADGTYSFTNLRPGTYTITETQPADYNDGIDTLGTVNSAPVGTVGADQFTGVVLVSGQTGADYLFAERGTTITGTVFRDVDKAGDLDVGTDAGIGGVTLTLRDGSNNIVATTVTLPDGTYVFNNVIAGNYTITETQPLGYGSSTPNALNATVTTAGLVDQNFGETLGSLTGRVFEDDNGDGIVNGADLGIVTTVTLTGTNALGQNVNITVSTNPDGTYSFNDLLSGSYTIAEAQPVGFDDNADYVGSLGGSNVVNDRISGIVVPAGTDGVNYNFTEIFAFSPTKTLVSTSNIGTVGANVTIGEVVRYRLVITLQQGQLNDYVIADSLPAGMRFLDDGTAALGFVSATGALVSSSTLGAAAGILAPTDTPTFLLPPEAISNSSNSDTNGWGSGTDVFFRLGNIANSATDPAAEYVVVEFNAQVVNELPNQAGRVLSNTFTARYDTSGDGVNDPLPPAVVSRPVRTTVVEPILSLDKQITAGPATPKPGDVVTFTVVVRHAAGSNATAWESLFTDTLPNGMTLVSITTKADGGAVVTQPAKASGNAISGQFDIPVNGSVTVTYQVRIGAGIKTGTTLTNGADITWTSMPGDEPTERKSGDSLLNKGGLNDYELKAQASVKVNAPPPADPPQFFWDGFNRLGYPRTNLPESPFPYIPEDNDIYRLPLLPLQPLYSGEADPGSTLVITMYNARNEVIGSQTVVVDSGGNWLTSFASTTMRDYPSTIQVTQTSAYYSIGSGIGNNLRTYYSPALNAGQFFFQSIFSSDDSEEAPLLVDQIYRNPINDGAVKYHGEVLASQGAAKGY